MFKREIFNKEVFMGGQNPTRVFATMNDLVIESFLEKDLISEEFFNALEDFFYGRKTSVINLAYFGEVLERCFEKGKTKKEDALSLLLFINLSNILSYENESFTVYENQALEFVKNYRKFAFEERDELFSLLYYCMLSELDFNSLEDEKKEVFSLIEEISLERNLGYDFLSKTLLLQIISTFENVSHFENLILSISKNFKIEEFTATSLIIFSNLSNPDFFGKNKLSKKDLSFVRKIITAKLPVEELNNLSNFEIKQALLSAALNNRVSSVSFPALMNYSLNGIIKLFALNDLDKDFIKTIIGYVRKNVLKDRDVRNILENKDYELLALICSKLGNFETLDNFAEILKILEVQEISGEKNGRSYYNSWTVSGNSFILNYFSYNGIKDRKVVKSILDDEEINPEIKEEIITFEMEKIKDIKDKDYCLYLVEKGDKFISKFRTSSFFYPAIKLGIADIDELIKNEFDYEKQRYGLRYICSQLSFNEKTQKIKDLNESKLLDKKMIDDIKLLDILKREIFLNLDKVSFEIDFYLDLVWRFNPSNYLFEVKNFILNKDTVSKLGLSEKEVKDLAKTISNSKEISSSTREELEKIYLDEEEIKKRKKEEFVAKNVKNLLISDCKQRYLNELMDEIGEEETVEILKENSFEVSSIFTSGHDFKKNCKLLKKLASIGYISKEVLVEQILSQL